MKHLELRCDLVQWATGHVAGEENPGPHRSDSAAQRRQSSQRKAHPMNLLLPKCLVPNDPPAQEEKGVVPLPPVLFMSAALQQLGHVCGRPEGDVA